MAEVKSEVEGAAGQAHPATIWCSSSGHGAKSKEPHLFFQTTARVHGLPVLSYSGDGKAMLSARTSDKWEDEAGARGEDRRRGVEERALRSALMPVSRATTSAYSSSYSSFVPPPPHPPPSLPPPIPPPCPPLGSWGTTASPALCSSVCCPTSLITSTRLGVVSGWAGGDTRSENNLEFSSFFTHFLQISTFPHNLGESNETHASNLGAALCRRPSFHGVGWSVVDVCKSL